MAVLTPAYSVSNPHTTQAPKIYAPTDSLSLPGIGVKSNLLKKDIDDKT